MKTIKTLFILSLLSWMTAGFAQNVIEGTVYEKVDGKRQPLQGVNVYWKIANVGTVTDEHGHYSIEIHPTYKCLVFSFVMIESGNICFIFLITFCSNRLSSGFPNGNTPFFP